VIVCPFVEVTVEVRPVAQGGVLVQVDAGAARLSAVQPAQIKT